MALLREDLGQGQRLRAGLAPGHRVAGPDVTGEVESGGVIADTNILVGTEVIYSGGRASGDIVQGSGTLYDDGGNATNPRRPTKLGP